MFSSAFREFESDPFFAFGNSPFNGRSFFRDEPSWDLHAADRRRSAQAALPPAARDADPDASRGPENGSSSDADQPAAATRWVRPVEADQGAAGRQLMHFDENVDRRRRRQGLMAGDDVFGLVGFGSMERHFNQMFEGMHRMMADMGDRMRQMEAAASRQDFDGHMYSHASVYSSSGGERPHVYQAVSETRAGPGGVRETRRAMRDSRSQEERMALGRHIGERGHVVERRRNAGTGHQEENHSYNGVEESASDAFDSEWQSRATALARGGGDGHRRPLPERRKAAPAAIESGRRPKL